MAISATQGNEIGQPHGVGLIEVTNQERTGKHKMKMAFGWMLRAISRERREAVDRTRAQGLTLHRSQDLAQRNRSWTPSIARLSP